MTAVGRISGLMKAWSMRMAGKPDGKVLTVGDCPQRLTQPLQHALEPGYGLFAGTFHHVRGPGR